MPARSLQPPLTVLGGAVLVTAAIVFSQGLFATVAFAALAAVVCRRLQLALCRRGVRNGLAITLTVVSFVVVLAALALAGFAAVAAMATEIAASSDELTSLADDLRAAIDEVAGLPPADVPAVDIATVLAVLRSVLGMLAPVVTGLLMAVLIVAYLLLDAGQLRERMAAATSSGVMARYDALAAELVVYVKVRAVLGGAAAIADTILLLVLGVPYAPLWGVLSFLFSFVPNLGFIVALIPPTVFAFLEGGLGLALLVVAGYVVINLTFDYVLQPRMMSTELDLSPVVTIVAILVWTLIVGPMGALLAVPLTIAMRAILLPFPGARWFVALLGPVPDDPVGASPVGPST
jgi:predicted PurR-regulated permease PerM